MWKPLQVHPCYCGTKRCISGIDGYDDIVELQHDIAVLTLEQPLHFNDFVQPACLPAFNSEVAASTQAMFSGWGKLKYDGQNPDSLQYEWNPIVSQADCQKKNKQRIPDDMLCAGRPGGGVDACTGDSGGPLVVVVEDERTMGRKPKKLTGRVLGHSFLCSLALSHRSLIRLPRIVRFARALHRAHLFVRLLPRSLTPELMGGRFFTIDCVNFLQFLPIVKRVVVVGVTSWGVKCATPAPGVYAKVAHAVDWIQEAMKDVVSTVFFRLTPLSP